MTRRTMAGVTALLSLEDEITVLELLDISTDELIEAFRPKIRERISYLKKHYEEEPEEASRSFRKYNDSCGIGSKQAWEDAGFDLESDSY